MKTDILTIALTEPQCALLKLLLRAEIPEEIHAIVTSTMESKSKTRAILTQMEDFRVMFGALTWDKNTDSLRAYRQLSPEGVIRIRELVMGADRNRMSPELNNAYQQLAPTILESVKRAIATNVDKPVMPVRMENPRAKA